MIKLLIGVLACCLTNTSAHLIKGKVDTRGQPIELQNTSIIVNHGQYTASVDNVGQFVLQVSEPGSYKLEVQNLKFYFEPVVVEIYAEEYLPGKNTKAFLFSLKNGKDINVRLAYPLHLEPSSRMMYFEVEQPLNLWAYAKNPFVIMVGVMLLMNLLTKGIDPEELKKAQAQQGDAMQNMPCQP